MEERWKLRHNEGKPYRETRAEYSQQDPSNLAIPTMAARAAPPDHSLDTPHFRFTRQLLPTFATRLLGLRNTGRFAASIRAVRGPSQAAQPSQNAGDMINDREHASRQRRPLHNYVRNLVPSQ